MRFLPVIGRVFVPLLGLIALSAGAGCGSNAGSSDAGAVFVPTFEASMPGVDGGVTHADGGVVVVTPPDGSIIPIPDATTGPTPDTGVMPPPGMDSGMTIVPSSGIVITVIPDGTGDAAGLLTAMKNAQTTVHMTMYLLTNQAYINELISLKGAGKDVKVILNQTFPTGTSASNTNASTYTSLKSAGVDVQWSPTTTGFDNYTHEKTVIIDPGGADESAWIMTMNLDTDAPKYNREYLAQDTNSADVAEAESIFEADFASQSITATGSLVVAPAPPNNCTSVLLDLVNSATTSIDMEAEEIDESGSSSETKIFAALVAKAKAGVSVHVVLEDSTESTQSTAVSGLQAAGATVVGYVYSGGSGLDIHAKALVADGARAYVGSENFTGGSLEYNREIGVYFTTASEVAKVQSTIASDFAGGSTYSSQ
jgi:cardiolipin synthase